MTRTERMKLYRWAPEDFVNLEQINSNFDALEQSGGDHYAAAETLRHHLAHDAQARYHDGTLPPRLKNLLTVDLSKRSGEVFDLTQLQDVYGTPMLVPEIEPSYSGQTAKMTIYENGAGVFCTLTPTGYGRITSVTTPAPSQEMDGVVLEIVEKDEVLYQSTPMNFSAGVQQTYQTDCPIAAGHSYGIRVRRTNKFGAAGWEFPVGSCSVAISGSVYEEGSFCTRSFAFGKGAALELWLYYTGEAPVLARSVDGGVWHDLSPEETEAGFTLAGDVCSVRRYCIRDAAGHTLRLRLTIGSSSTLVKEICGAML